MSRWTIHARSLDIAFNFPLYEEIKGFANLGNTCKDATPKRV